MSDQSTPIITCTISDGYNFRNTINSIRNLCKNFTLFFRPSGLEIQERNETGDIFFDCTFSGRSLFKYEYKAFNPATNELSELIKVRLDSGDFNKRSRLIGKRDMIKLTHYKNGTNLIIEVIKRGATKDSEDTCLMLRIVNELDIPVLLPPDLGPEANFKLSASTVSESFVAMSTLKCNKIRFKFYKKGIAVFGIVEAGDTGYYAVWGEIEGQEKQIRGGSAAIFDVGGPLFEMILSSKVIRSLSKINNISGNTSIVSFFYKKDSNEEEQGAQKVLGISTPIGSQGTYNLYIR